MRYYEKISFCQAHFLEKQVRSSSVGSGMDGVMSHIPKKPPFVALSIATAFWSQTWQSGACLSLRPHLGPMES